MIKMMTINDLMRDEKLHYYINKEAAKVLALSSGEIHKYGYLTGEDILPSNQTHNKSQKKLNLLILLCEKRIKTIEDQGKKEVDALKNLKPK